VTAAVHSSCARACAIGCSASCSTL
jgi:hypothetical protein